MGELQNVKVTVKCGDKGVTIYIHDHTFYTFKDALRYLQRDAQMIAAPKNDLEVI